MTDRQVLMHNAIVEMTPRALIFLMRRPVLARSLTYTLPAWSAAMPLTPNKGAPDAVPEEMSVADVEPASEVSAPFVSKRNRFSPLRGQPPALATDAANSSRPWESSAICVLPSEEARTLLVEQFAMVTSVVMTPFPATLRMLSVAPLLWMNSSPAPLMALDTGENSGAVRSRTKRARSTSAPEGRSAWRLALPARLFLSSRRRMTASGRANRC